MYNIGRASWPRGRVGRGRGLGTEGAAGARVGRGGLEAAEAAADARAPAAHRHAARLHAASRQGAHHHAPVHAGCESSTYLHRNVYRARVPAGHRTYPFNIQLDFNCNWHPFKPYFISI